MAASTGERWAPPPALASALRPWIDIAGSGPVGFHAWLETILPLLPPPGSGRRRGGRPPDREGRLIELARALADCAGDRARAHFEASEYYRDNTLLARRVKALEAMLANRAAETDRSPPPSVDAEPVRSMADRYLPRARKP